MKTGDIILYKYKTSPNVSEAEIKRCTDKYVYFNCMWYNVDDIEVLETIGYVTYRKNLFRSTKREVFYGKRV